MYYCVSLPPATLRLSSSYSTGRVHKLVSITGRLGSCGREGGKIQVLPTLLLPILRRELVNNILECGLVCVSC